MRIEQLQFLIQVANYKSLSAASESMHITQQALNANIKNLEEELGLSLLSRSNRGVSLTPTGKILVQKASEVVNSLYDTIYELKHGQAMMLEKDIQIAVETGLLEYKSLARKLVNCQIKYNTPSGEIRIAEQEQQQLLKDLVDRKIDIGIFASCEVLPEDLCLQKQNFVCRSIGSYQLCVHISQNSPLAVYKSLSLKTLAKYKIILRKFASGYTPVESILKKYEADIDIHYVDSLTLQTEMVANNLGISFSFLDLQTQEENTNAPDGIVTRQLKENIGISQYIAISGDNPQKTVLETISNYLLLWLAV